MAVSVTFEHVTKRFGAVAAVDNVSLEVAPGELFFLLGPSGCGKTTLLRCAAGFCEPDAGRILIDGQDVTPLPPHRRETGMVFQSYALWPHMTVRGNVAFGLEMRGTPRRETDRRVAEALDMVKMADRADHKPNQLSGGQQQRVALARALVIRPRCLLLDEPLSNLDAKLRLEMRGEIRSICKDAGLTAVYVTHDQKEALSIADRLAVIRGGGVEQVGAPPAIYRQPANRFVAEFIGETNFLKGRVVQAAAGTLTVRSPAGDILSAPPPGVAFSGGEDVTLCLRPEQIRLGPGPAGQPNVLGGTIRSAVYWGEQAQYEVDVPCSSPPAGGPAAPEAAPLRFKVSEMNPRILAAPGDGRVSLWIDPADVVVLKD